MAKEQGEIIYFSTHPRVRIRQAIRNLVTGLVEEFERQHPALAAKAAQHIDKRRYPATYVAEGLTIPDEEQLAVPDEKQRRPQFLPPSNQHE